MYSTVQWVGSEHQVSYSPCTTALCSLSVWCFHCCFKTSSINRQVNLLEKFVVLKASQEISHILWNHKTHYHGQKSQPLALFSSTLIQTMPSNLISLITILLASHLYLGIPSLLFRLPTKTLYAFILFSMYMHFPEYLYSQIRQHMNSGLFHE